MAVAAGKIRSPKWSADGTNRSWTFSFGILAADHLFLEVWDTAGTRSVVTSGFSVEIDSRDGGTVTYPIAPAAPLPAAYQLRVGRFMRFEQPERLDNQSDFHADTIEDGLDLLAMQVQQIAQYGTDRGLTAPYDDDVLDMNLPLAATRSGKILEFDGLGKPAVVRSFGEIITAAEEAGRIAGGQAIGAINGDALVTMIPDSPLAAPRVLKTKLGDVITPYDFNGANVSIKAQNAVDYMATKGYGGTLHFPPGDHTLTQTLTVRGDNIHLAGLGGADSVRLLRGGDFGSTVRFAKDNGQIMNGFGLHDVWFVDTNNSMTAGVSPAHIEMDYVARGAITDLLFSQGTGAMLCKGANQTMMNRVRGSFPVGSPAGRSAMLFTKTFAELGGAPVPYGMGGGIWLVDCDMQGGFGPGDSHLDYGFQFNCGDGFWLLNCHSQWTKLANMRLAKIYAEQLSNLLASNLFLDMCDGHGLQIETGIAQRILIDGVISCNQNGEAGKHGIYFSSGGIDDGHFDVTIEGFKGAPVYEEAAATNTDVFFRFKSIRNCDFGNSFLNGTGISPLSKTLAWDIPSIATGSGDFINIPVAGARVGDLVTATLSVPLQGLELIPEVSGAGMVTVTVRNRTGAAVNPAAGAVTVRVTKPVG